MRSSSEGIIHTKTIKIKKGRGKDKTEINRKGKEGKVEKGKMRGNTTKVKK